MQEPSILDYVKARLSFGRIPLPQTHSEDVSLAAPAIEEQPDEAGEDLLSQASPALAAAPAAVDARSAVDVERAAATTRGLPWRTLGAFLLAILAQSILDPHANGTAAPASLYLLSAGMLILAMRAGEWRILPLRAQAFEPLSLEMRLLPLYLLLPFLVVAFLLFSNNRFTSFNVLVWAISIGLLLWALWLPRQGSSPRSFSKRIPHWISQLSHDPIRISWFGVLLIGVALMAVFFRYYQLSQVPGQMFSDHAEKLLDVQDVLDGQYSIFFPRNTGREAIQMYLTAFIARFLGFGVSFISLKLGTATAGLLTLPFIYLLGKEVANKWVGLAAVTLAAFAYWPNVIARVGLRFPLYPLFTAPMLFFLVRGLRTQNRNDFILAGLALGLGLHGYSPMRIAPFVVVIAVGLYLLHAQSRGKRTQTFWALIVLAFVSFVIFLPLFRYMLSNPDMFGYRAFSRLGSNEQALPGPALLIFLSNLWKASIMFWVSNGSIWVHSVTDRPALDVITAVFLFLGGFSLFVRYLRRRHWLDLFLLVSAPLLMMPSILSLAFPGENPSLNRSGAAYIPVFVIAAIGMEAFLSAIFHRIRSWNFWRRPETGSAFAGLAVVIMALLLTGISARQNYDLVFNQYKHQFLGGAWNTTDLGQVIRSFATMIGTPDTAYVVPYAHWVDTRLVGINAGYPRKDYALWAQDFPSTLDQPNPKLFLLKPEDQESLAQLQQMYPNGTQKLFHVSEYDGKDFIEFFVPPDTPDVSAQSSSQP